MPISQWVPAVFLIEGIVFLGLAAAGMGVKRTGSMNGANYFWFTKNPSALEKGILAAFGLISCIGGLLAYIFTR